MFSDYTEPLSFSVGQTLGSRQRNMTKSFLKVLKGAIGLDPDARSPARPTRKEPLFVYVKIPANIAPLERGDRFEDPLQAALEAADLGEITGGGSQLGEPDPDGRPTIEFCGIDVNLFNRDQGIALLRQELVRLGAPAGTVLLYEVEGREYEQPVHEAWGAAQQGDEADER
jgi:hypothetical protein